MTEQWHVSAHWLPKEASRSRAAVWHELRRLEVVALGQGAWALLAGLVRK